jgi:hypothetical protein
MKITIVGGWSETPSENTEWKLDVGDRTVFVQACRAVGARLAERGHAIVVGNDAEYSADRHVVEGASCMTSDGQQSGTSSAPASRAPWP